MDTPTGPPAPFPLPAEFKCFVETVNTFAHLHIYRVTVECEGLSRHLDSKAFNPRDKKDMAQRWLELMAMTGNVLILGVMPPDMLVNFEPMDGGGMKLVNQKEN